MEKTSTSKTLSNYRLLRILSDMKEGFNGSIIYLAEIIATGERVVIKAFHESEDQDNYNAKSKYLITSIPIL